MSVTTKNIYSFDRAKDQGKRGFPGPAGPVSGGSYPGAGIPLSTGTAWGTSITNNSANWNTAYGWGNHASAGYASAANPTLTGSTTVDNIILNNNQQERFIRGLFNGGGIRMRSNNAAATDRGLKIGQFDNTGAFVVEWMDFREDGSKGIATVNGRLIAEKLQTANWSIEEDGSDLVIKRGTSILARLSSVGAWNTRDEQESHDLTP